MQFGEMAMRIGKRGWWVIGLALAAVVAVGFIIAAVLESVDQTSPESPRARYGLGDEQSDTTAWQRMPPTVRPFWETVFRGGAR
jgi:hypothetical protein